MVVVQLEAVEVAVEAEAAVGKCCIICITVVSFLRLTVELAPVKAIFDRCNNLFVLVCRVPRLVSC